MSSDLFAALIVHYDSLRMPDCLRCYNHCGCSIGAPSEDYKDGEDVECEIVQIIGDIEMYEDLSPRDVLL